MNSKEVIIKASGYRTCFVTQELHPLPSQVPLFKIVALKKV